MKTETHQNFPEVKGKIVDKMELTVEADFFGISIRFQDKTSLTFSIEPCAFTFPIYSEWIEGEEKILKEYPPIKSVVGEVVTETRLKES